MNLSYFRLMKLVLAPDKFKKSLTALEFCNAVEEGIRAIKPDLDIIRLPLADGGDGTIDVMQYHLKGDVIYVLVNNPFFKLVKAKYLYSKFFKTAYIEMAEASGFKLLKPEQLDCKNATTFGTGELIIDAINRGASKIILGIGGSATNDCGIGMATALGYQFLDENNNKVKPIGANLSKIRLIDASNVDSRLNEINFSVACDVTNPLFGEHGAAYVYGAQKGATASEIKMLDEGLQSFSKLIEKVFKVNPQEVKGAGAAGGMGIASKVFLNGVLESGFKLIKNSIDFDTKIKNADWVITGEGKLDAQTSSGKTLQGVLSSAREKGVKVAVICGDIDLEGRKLLDGKVHYIDTVMNHAKHLDDAMSNSFMYVKEIAKKFAEKNL